MGALFSVYVFGLLKWDQANELPIYRIRPLLTQDVRMRREGGRSQISTDGMKLIDGVPFGKSKPLQAKRIRRPPVSIPPLKRRRITYDEDDSDELPQEEHTYAVEEDESGNRQLVLSADFEDDDEEDDEDFNPEGQDKDEDDDEEEDEEIQQNAEAR